MGDVIHYTRQLYATSVGRGCDVFHALQRCRECLSTTLLYAIYIQIRYPELDDRSAAGCLLPAVI